MAMCVAAVTAMADENQPLDRRVESLQAQVDDIMAKAGIQFSGEFNSQMLLSTVDGDGVDSTNKKSESVMFTSVDFDITARPNTALTARAMFRLHQDWRNFFSDVQNPITTRWLSIDGTVLDGLISYNFGDYKKKISPLTLWSPDLELMFEPEIFAMGRRYAMNEVFLGENNRVLQGGNVEFSAKFDPFPSDIEFGVFGARLATRGTFESGVVPPGVTLIPNGEYDDAPWDKYLVGANFGTQIIDGAGLGVTYMHIYDALTSFEGTENEAKFDGVSAQSTGVLAFRANVDSRVAGLDDPLRVGVDFEMAMSSDRVYDVNLNETTVDGNAINAGLNLRFALGEEDAIRLNATYVMNDPEFRNDAAQSPSFIPFPIINNENISTVNPFDAMYRSVFKYAPSQYFGRARPYTKNNYGNAILPQHVASAQPQLPFQAALPGGLATADRVGIVGSINGSALENGLRFGVRVAMLEGEEVSYIDEDIIDVKYTPGFEEIIAGASVDVARFVPAVGESLEIGGSFGIYNQTLATDTENMLIGVGLDYKFHRRFGLLAGYQMMTSTFNVGTASEVEHNFTNLSFGLGYRVADGGTITAKLTHITADFGGGNEYSALQPEVFLTVRF